jgi:AsmA family
MTEDDQGRHRTRRRLWLALAAVVVLLVLLVAAPLVSLNRYKSRITHLMAASLGRPVRLSSVELRLLPRPGFVLYDLTVDEDPAYGAEPVLHASTVTASIRLLSLWSGRLEISRISVDDASLNLVRTGEGQWNLGSLFHTAAEKAGAAAGAGPRSAAPLPYLEATNSRINIKNGAEKLPYSLVDADLSFWQDEPGEWRIRLRGQPARTDLIVQGADTGLVRLEASVHRAPELRWMPVHLDLDWRDAQLGQLSRLLIGSDPGWRGDLTWQLHLDGTADAAQIKTRLRATGVHRAEFAPAAPMDFDANCGFLYHYSERAVENLLCDSPLGDGHVRLSGNLPGKSGSPHFSVELDRIPVAVGLDALRTLRSGFGPGLEATGDISGKIGYAEGVQENGAPQKTASKAPAGKVHATGPYVTQAGPLTGSFTVERFQLGGDGLREPILIPKLVLEPEVGAIQGQQEGASRFDFEHVVLAATVALPAGSATPLTVTTHLGLSGYQLTVRGQAALSRAREFAHVAGMPDAALLDALAGDALTVDLTAEGPWMQAETAPLGSISPSLGTPEFVTPEPAALEPVRTPASADALTDRLTGTVTLHSANWKSDYLASHVEIPQATLHLDRVGDDTRLRWEPLVFSYGPVKGTAIVTLPASCAAGQPCPARNPVHFQVEFGALDAAALQAAIMGAHEKGTLLSELINRLSPSSPAPVWPELEGTVKADSLILGPVTLEKPSATVRILNNGAEITGLNAGILGGQVHGTGTLSTGDANHRLPDYALTGTFEKLSPVAVGQLLGQHWPAGVLNAGGKIELSGFTGKDLASSAKGNLHFEWRHGALTVHTGASPVRFERWTGEAEITNGTIAVKRNQMLEGGRKQKVDASVQLEDPPSFTVVPSRETQAKR